MDKEINVRVKLPLGVISILLDVAFGPTTSAVYYWCQISRFQKPPEIRYQTFPERVCDYCDYPLNPGGALVLNDNKEINSDHLYFLELASIKDGLELMAREHPHLFAEIVSCNIGKKAADVFVQCCVFGKVRYQ